MKKLLCISLILIFHQLSAMSASDDAYTQGIRAIVRKANELQQMQLLEDLGKALGHYSILHSFIFTKIAAGQEVPKKESNSCEMK